MIEQLNLFGEKDPFAELCDNIVKAYESNKKDEEHTENFDVWLRHCFSSYSGGNSFMYVTGYNFFDFSPKGLKLTDSHTLIKYDDHTEWKSLFFPKQKILKAFGIKDDKKDMDEIQEDNYSEIRFE